MIEAAIPFGARLHQAMADRGPVCVGIDPHAGLLADWGLADSPAGLRQFALTAAEALGPEVSVVKPQSAFFERHGSRGIAVLEETIQVCREAGAQVLLDVKRGDIGSTSQAYADAYLDPTSPLAVDAITASPYLGFGSLGPMIDTALAHGAGLFVLALTSNKEGLEVQGAARVDGSTVAGGVLRELRRRNSGIEPMGSLGAVVGATLGEHGEDLAMNGPLLAPGVGAQGGTVEDIRRIFGAESPRVIPSTSREVLGAGPERAALREAARRTNEAFASLSVR